MRPPSFTSQSTAIGIPAASVIDAPTAAVLRQIPNLGSSLDAPIQLNIQSEDKPTRCLVLKNVFDPDPSQKEGSKYYKCIRDDIHQNCGKYGTVFLKFGSTRSAVSAHEALHEKEYRERTITANFMGMKKYDSMFGTWGK